MKISSLKFHYWILRALPNFLWPLKIFLIRSKFHSIGKNFRFGPNSIFDDPRLFDIGYNVFFADRTVIYSNVNVKIGNNVMFGPEVMILGGDHNYKIVGEVMSAVKSGGQNLKVFLEDDVWIGARSIILKGVTIGEGTIVGAGSIVNKSLPPYSISVGNPCHPIKSRFNLLDLEKHLFQTKSKYSLSEINESYKKWGIKIMP